jgi:hypothetical protein
MGRLASVAAAVLVIFTQQLDHRHERLLDRPSIRYPEMTFER